MSIEEKNTFSKSSNNKSQDIIKEQLIQENSRESHINEINSEFQKEKNQIDNIYYIPICRNKGCDGHLSISIDEEQFLISGKCQKNKEHIFNDLFFETFDRFYLKKFVIQNCFKCHKNLDFKDNYETEDFKNIYCSDCFYSDINNKNLKKKFKLLTNKCKNDENLLVNYCLDCGEKICLFCLKKDIENNPHKNHKVINILDNMPSKNQLNILKEKILKKSEAFDSLLESLNEWQNELNKRIERLKQNLIE